MRKLRRKHDSKINKKFYFWSTIIIIVLLIILGYAKAQSPQAQAKKEAYLVAKKYGNVRKVENRLITLFTEKMRVVKRYMLLLLKMAKK